MAINQNDFTIQDFENLQNVNADNMNLFYQNVDQKISAYFPIQPGIINGVEITQTGTSNSFSINFGQMRFLDQTNVDSSGISQMTLANIPDVTSMTITVGGTGSSPQYYIVAVLSLNPQDNFKVGTSASISSIAMTLAQIAAQTNPNLYVPVATITTPDNIVYTMGTDTNCAPRIQDYYPDITDDTSLYRVNITGDGGLVVYGISGITALTGNVLVNEGGVYAPNGSISAGVTGSAATLYNDGSISTDEGIYGAGHAGRVLIPGAGTSNDLSAVLGDSVSGTYNFPSGGIVTAFYTVNSTGKKQVIITGTWTVDVGLYALPFSLFGIGIGSIINQCGSTACLNTGTTIITAIIIPNGSIAIGIRAYTAGTYSFTVGILTN